MLARAALAALVSLLLVGSALAQRPPTDDAPSPLNWGRSQEQRGTDRAPVVVKIQDSQGPLARYKEIILALIAVLGVVVPYLLQKNKELNLKIAEQKRAAYAAFLGNFTEIAVAVMHDEELSGKEADRERMLARDQLLLYASDEVIRAYDVWSRYSDKDMEKETELVNLMLLAIRRDILGKTKVTKDHVDNLSSFSRG